MSRLNTSDAFPLFSALCHNSQIGHVQWLLPSISYVFRNEMGRADAFRCLLKVPLIAPRRGCSKSILFALLVNHKYFVRATPALQDQGQRMRGALKGAGCSSATNPQLCHHLMATQHVEHEDSSPAHLLSSAAWTLICTDLKAS